MSTASAYLTVRGIGVDIVYKDIKNLHIGVYPPLGRVRVAAPRRLGEDQIRLAVVQRLPWIKRKRDELQSAERQSERRFVSGETHYVWGVGRRLRVIRRPGRGHVELDGDRLLLYVPPDAHADARQKLLEAWQRRQLREAIPALITQWEPVIGREVPSWGIRRMKTKWGTCNQDSGRLWFNLELAKKHPRTLEYIVVHEMTHLLERGHGERFTALMDAHMTDWRARRDELNAAPLAEETW